jgi:hypothetical protein
VLLGTRVTILEAMTDLGIAVDYGRGPLARLIRVLPLPINVRQALSNVTRKKGRLFLTWMTLTLAVGSFMGVYSVFSSLGDQIDAIFQAQTRRTAEKRYRKVIALRHQYAPSSPTVSSVFDSLERHWPTLVNGIESTIIPRTNNATELVIRRFDQHYQNFCAFDSLASARLFLAVFEKVYRFTPFTPDAQPRIRNKCPLELAGYDVACLPMAQLCKGWALNWATTPSKPVVPNV